MKLLNILKLYFNNRQDKQRYKLDREDIRFISSLVKPYKNKFVVSFLLIMVNSALLLPSPAIMGLIVDKVFIQKDFTYLTQLIILLILILLFSNYFSLLQEYYIAKFRQSFSNALQIKLIRKVLNYPLTFFNSKNSGYITSRISEASLIGDFFSSSSLNFLVDAIKVIVSFVILMYINSKLTLISLLFLPLIFEISRRYSLGIKKSNFQSMEETSKIQAKVQEVFSNIECLKIFTTEEDESNKIEKKLNNLLQIELQRNVFTSFSTHILYFLSGLNLVVILWFSGFEILHGRLTVGQYVSFVAYLSLLVTPIQSFAGNYLRFQRVIITIKRVSEMFSYEKEDNLEGRINFLDKVQGKIEFSHVYFGYGETKNLKNILKDFNLKIEPGEKVLITGLNGSGKTTFVNLILALYQPQLGEIFIDGINLSSINLNSLREKIGIVSQNIYLFNDSIMNNIRYGCKEKSNSKIIEAATYAGADEFIAKLEQGYDTPVGEFGKKLSGGQKQRLSIARILLRNPEIIIFDELDAHLDSIILHDILNLLKNHLSTKTSIFISHWIREDWFDKIYRIENGKVAQVNNDNYSYSEKKLNTATPY